MKASDTRSRAGIDRTHAADTTALGKTVAVALDERVA